MRAICTFESDDFGCRVHDSGICGNWPPDGVCGVGHVNDDDLVSLPHFLPHTNELVRLHGKAVEADVGRVDAHIGELQARKCMRAWAELECIREPTWRCSWNLMGRSVAMAKLARGRAPTDSRCTKGVSLTRRQQFQKY